MARPTLTRPRRDASWSPDGKQIVCHTYNRPQTIVVMNADGTGRETILNHWGSPRWSPHGNRIASINLNSGLALFDLATGREIGIQRGPHTLRPGFAVAPDGIHFCFGEESGGVFVGTLDEKRQLLDSRCIWQSDVFCHAAWSPDGRQVVFGEKEARFGSYPLPSPNPPRPIYRLHLYDVVSDAAPRSFCRPGRQSQ